MPQLLALDYGSKRTGIAVTDDLQIIASGLTTVQTKDLFKFLVDYFKKHEGIIKRLFSSYWQRKKIQKRSPENR